MRTEDRAPSSDAKQNNDRSPAERPSVADYALLEELRFVRREAQAEANLAYEDWVGLPTGESYAVYRAAQDRADAAHRGPRRAAQAGRATPTGWSPDTFP